MPPYSEQEQMGGSSIILSKKEIMPSFAILQQSDVFLEDPAEAIFDTMSLGAKAAAITTAVSMDDYNSDTSIGSSSSKKRVSFANLQVREHSVVLGDHPCCTIGLPVTLGWNFVREYTISLEDYEAAHAKERRSRHELRLSLDDRRDLLKEEVADGDLRKIQRKLHRVRQNRCMSGRAKEMFFQCSADIKVTE